MLKDQIIQVLKNTFKTDDISKLKDHADVARIPRLSSLLASLAEEKITPKDLRNALEIVVVSIKMEEEKTAREIEFLKQVKTLINDPLYVSSGDADADGEASEMSCRPR
jgi:hypothetical protein